MFVVLANLSGCASGPAGVDMNENGPVSKIVDKNGNSTTGYWGSENSVK